GLYVSNNATSWANNIFEGNTAPAGPNCDEDAAGDSDSAGNNIIVVTTNCPTTGSDITGVSPNLGTLATNGGTTLNRLPAGGSNAIDAANATFAPAVDQRGAARPFGGVDDIGSVEVGVDLTPPVIAEVTPVPTPDSDTTPSYTFSSDEAGTITYGGDCSSGTTSATVGNNTITFNALSVGAHTNCTIMVTDASTNDSNILNVTAFTITSAPLNIGRILFQNDDFATVYSDSLVINSDDQAAGDISVKFGNTIAESLTWDVSESEFNLSAGLDLNSNQLTSFRTENATAFPGGAPGLGGGGTGRLIMLTSSDNVAPGCTPTPCDPGIYVWDGTEWLPLFGVGGAGTPGGNANDIQYNDAGVFGGENALEYDAATNQVTAPGVAVGEDFALTGDISPAQLTANQNDYNPTGLDTASVIRISGDTSFRTITGIAGGADGRIIKLHNIGTSTILLANRNTGSTATNRFDFGGNDVPLFPGDLLSLQYDSTSGFWRTDTDTHIIPPARWGLYHYHDMLGVTTDSAISSQVSGTSAANSATAITSVAAHSGVVQHTTGTTATGRAAMMSINPNNILLGNSWYWRYDSMVRITTLSDGTNRFIYRNGFLDSPSAEPTDGVYFRYSDNLNTGQWQLVCRSNGTETATASTSAPAAATWYRLTIIVNPAGSSAEFFVDGTSIGTCASNLPTGAGRGTGFGSFMLKSVGLTARTIDLDYVEITSYANSVN
ncbi:MAG: choice-of-anchor Q domain-containing protein, partial [Candidatus Altimarinota bacterium]